MTTPPFTSLPEGPIPKLRWVGTMLMDEEQYRIEGWFRNFKGYWIARLAGLQEYGRLYRDREQQLIAERIARREANDEWSRVIERQIQGEP